MTNITTFMVFACLIILLAPSAQAEEIPYLKFQLDPKHLDYETEAVDYYNELFNRARQAIDQNNWSTAYDFFLQLSELDVENQSFILALAQMAFWRDDWDTVLKHTEQPLGEPYTIRAYILRGAAFLNSGRYEAAAQTFRSILVADPESTLAQLGLNDAQSKLENAKATGQSSFMTRYKKMYAAGEGIPASITAKMLFIEGNQNEAIDLLLAELEENPESVDAHSSVAAFYAAQGNEKSAKHHIEKAARLAPDNPYILNNSGVLAMQRKEDAAALRTLIRAIQLKPDYAVAYRNLSRLHIARGEWTDSISMARKAIQLEQDSVTSRMLLAFSSYQLGFFGQALDYLKPTLRPELPRPAVWFLAGICAHIMNAYEDAEHYYRIGLVYKPDYVLGLNNLADVIIQDENSRREKIEEAVTLAERASELTQGTNQTIERTLTEAMGRLDNFK